MNKESIIKEGGFSLIEILVTILIFSVISLVASNSLFTLLRGSANIETNKELKQNGEYAIGVLEQRIRNAKQITSACPDIASPQSLIIIKNQDDTATTFSCAGSRILEGATSYLTNALVEVVDCTAVFSCTSVNSKPAEVIVTFSLTPADLTTPQETFISRISLRNK